VISRRLRLARDLRHLRSSARGHECHKVGADDEKPFVELKFVLPDPQPALEERDVTPPKITPAERRDYRPPDDPIVLEGRVNPPTNVTGKKRGFDAASAAFAGVSGGHKFGQKLGCNYYPQARIEA
jgi:hypothetical protein